MSDYQTRISRLVDDFVAQVTAMAREAATETLANALGNAAARRTSPKAPVPSPSLASPRRTKGAKRGQDEIEQTKSRVHDFIRSNPGMRIEQINKQLGTTTKDLSLPLKKLISEGSVRTEGAKRSTQYFAGDGKSKRGEGTAPKRRKKK